MSEVENVIQQFESPQREILKFFHGLLVDEFLLTAKISFGNPCYYGKSWICYLKPLKNNSVELAFLRGNELSENQDLLISKGRKQLRSLGITNLSTLPIEAIRMVLNEAVLLDEVKPFESKRKRIKE